MLPWERVTVRISGSGVGSGVGLQVQVGGSVERLYMCACVSGSHKNIKYGMGNGI